MKRNLGFFLMILVLLASILPSAIPVIASDGMVANPPPLDLLDNTNPRLDSQLNFLVAAQADGESGRLPKENTPDFQNGNIRVVIECLPGEIQNVIEAARELISIETSRDNLIQAVVLPANLTVLAEIPGVSLVRMPMKVVPTVESEGLDLINATCWHSAGYTGSGMKVGIIDAGFIGYSSLLGTELPASVTAQSFSSNAGFILEAVTEHGTACAEVVHDMAPDAQLYLTNISNDVELGDAVDWLISHGVDVISCSLAFFPGGPGDGTGVICEEVDSAQAAGILWSQSAGNYATTHWQGTFSDPDADGYHNFGPTDVGNTIYVNAGQYIDIFLRWDDGWNTSSNDYVLVLVDNSSPANVLTYSNMVQAGAGHPYEGISSFPAPYTGTYGIAIFKYDAIRDVDFDLFCMSSPLEYQVADNSLSVPADSPNAVTVGAVPWDDPATLEFFSSQGPTQDGRIKPDLVAPDGVTNVTYGTFGGTSASTPHVAGAAALVKQAYPAYTPSQIQSYFETNAIDLGDAGKDNLYGSGRLYLPSMGGSISGTVTDQSTGLPIADVSVVAYYPTQYGPQIVSTTFTNADGTYTINNLEYGSYSVLSPSWEKPGSADADYAIEVWQETIPGGTFDLVTVAEGVNPTGIDFTLEPGGIISGHVYDYLGSPIDGATIHAFEHDSISDGSMRIRGVGFSGADGYYETSALPTGTYGVLSQADGYISEWYNNTPNQNEANIVEVTAPNAVLNIDFSLEQGGSISGTVIDQATGLPVVDASSGSINLDIGFHKFVYRHEEVSGGQNSRAAFKAPGDTDWRWFSTSELEIRTSPDLGYPAGMTLTNKKNTFGHPQNHYEMLQCVDITSTEEFGWYGSSIVDIVNHDENIHGNDDNFTSYYEGYFYVNTAGTWQFSTDSDDASEICIDEQVVAIWYNGHGSANRWDNKFEVAVSKYDTGEHITSNCGNADGSYTIGNLPSGSYKVRAIAPGYTHEWFYETFDYNQATPVPVTAPGNTGGVDFTLEKGGSISGYVYESDGVTPIPSAQVCVNSFYTGQGFGCINTDVNGFYQLSGLPTGMYVIGANAPGFVQEYYDDVYGQHNASPVNVTAPDDTGNINFTLEQAGSISGYVYESDGVTPISNLHVNAHDINSNVWTAGTNTAQDGSYTLFVPTGTYRIMAHSSQPYAGEYYNNTYDSAQATPVPVTAPGDVPGINFILEEGGMITGYVYESDGVTPIPNLHVNASDYTTNSWLAGYNTNQDGSYTLVVPAGTYRVRACPSAGSGLPYIDEFYDDTYDYGQAYPVPVTVGQTTSNINFSLDSGGSISGYVYESDGVTPISNLNVNAIDVVTGQWMGGTNTDNNGHYVLYLPTGNYKVQACSSCSGLPYVNEWYDNVYDEIQATPVPVTVPDDTPNINFILDTVAILPDLIISEKHEEWVVEGESFTVHFTVQNIGEGIAPAGHDVGLVIPISETKEVPVDLGPGESWSGSFDTIIDFPGNPIVVFVIADYSSEIVESEESNNLRINTISYPAAPDLVVQFHEEWVDDGIYVVHFTVINQGNADTVAGHDAALNIDGTVLENMEIPVILAPGAGYSGTFATSVPVSDGWDTVTVCVDTNDEIAESMEGNNCQSLTIAWPPAPDLVTLVINYSWIDQDTYTVLGAVFNRGNAVAPAGHDISLTVDGVLITTEEVPMSLLPGGFGYGTTFGNIQIDMSSATSHILPVYPEGLIENLDWLIYPGVIYSALPPELLESIIPNSLSGGAEISLTGGSDDVTVCSDYNNELIEAREDNNCMTIQITGTQPDVIVNIQAPDEVLPDSDFSAFANITQVNDLNAAQYDIWFDPTVLRLDAITDGMINGVPFPVPTGEIAPQEIAPGHWRIVQSLGLSSITGSGYLAQLHFHVIGAIGNYSDIYFSDGLLSDMSANAIPAAWLGARVDVTVIRGDADGNGVVNVLDMTKVARIILGLDPPTPGADCNVDGEINVLDMTCIAKKILGIGPMYGGILKLAGPTAIINIGNPKEVITQSDTRYGAPSLEGLIKLDSTGNLQPWLAESWAIAGDGSTITFYLRQGVKFHDGTDFNAEAVKYNIDSLINAGFLPSVASCDVLGPYIVRLNFVGGVFDWAAVKMLATSGNCMMFSPIAVATQPPEWLHTHPIGTGPFSIVDCEPDLYVKYVKFEYYWQSGKPYLDGVNYYVISDPITRIAAYKAGEIHATDIQPADAADLIANGYQVQENSRSCANSALIADSANLDSPFSNIKVRRAMEYAIDKHVLVDVLNYGYGNTSNQPFIGTQQEYNPAVTGYNYNPQKARELLDEAGYPDGFMTQLYITDTMPLDLALAIQAYAADVGIAIQINVVSVGQFMSLSYTGWEGLLLGRRIAGPMVDPGISLNGPLGESSWVSNSKPAELLTLAASAASELDHSTRVLTYQDIAKKMTDDYAQWGWLYWTPGLFSVSPVVHNVDFTQSSFDYAFAWLNQ